MTTVTNNADAMHPVWLRFRDAALEDTFELEQAQKLLRPLRILAAGTALFLLGAFAISDRVIPFQHAQQRAVVLVLVAMAGLGLLFGLTYSRFFLLHLQRFTLILVCLFTIFVTALVSLAPYDLLRASGFVLPLIHTFNVYTLFRFRFPNAVIAGWFVMAAYLTFMFLVVGLAPSEGERHMFYMLAANLFGMFAAYQLDLFARREFLSMRALAAERERSERLLLNILPAEIADRLKISADAIADQSEQVTVLFADIVGFTPLSERLGPKALVQLLDRVFSEFDTLADQHGLEKIKTIGDAYMAAAGLPKPLPDHVGAAARMAQGILEAVDRVAQETGEKLAVRVGLHSGTVVAGVIGTRKFSYDMWGDTVNTASRMESHGIAGKIHCSAETAALLKDRFRLTLRGHMDIKGKGEMETYFLG